MAKLEGSAICTVVDPWDGPVGGGVGLLSRGYTCMFSCALRLATCLIGAARGWSGPAVVDVVVEFLAVSNAADGADRGPVRFEMLNVCTPRKEVAAKAR